VERSFKVGGQEWDLRTVPLAGSSGKAYGGRSGGKPPGACDTFLKMCYFEPILDACVIIATNSIRNGTFGGRKVVGKL